MLEKIGITEEERKQRNLTFHAWRHWYNSMLKGSVPDALSRKLTGHGDEKMNERYSEVTEKQRKAVYDMAGKILN